VPIGVSQFLRAARPNMVAYKSGSLSNSQQGHSGGHPIQLGPGATGTTRPPGSAGMAQLQQQRIAVPQFTLPITLPVPFGNRGGPPKNLASQAMDI
jgi:hypothetical protein